MRNLADLFPAWTHALGWSLLNSLWQALVIVLLATLILRIIPTRLSQLRYVLSCAAMVAVIVLHGATFLYLLQDNSAVHEFAPVSGKQTFEILPTAITPSTLETTFGSVLDLLGKNMPLIILCWIAGTIIFSLRMLSAWWYVSRLRSEAVVLKNAWSDRLQDLARELRIDRAITLAQSSGIDTPVVMGLLKPIILVPVGMFSGLTTAQIESIFIHELAHIRRHDYLINLIQSFIETIFFFNPFVWIISNIIRREREFCCDDAVIVSDGNALAYAHALTQLEEVRLSKSTFALSLAADKNQLLNRIKRIMEKSVKNYPGRDRLIPALLLVIGLVCASWLTIKTERQKTGVVSQDLAIEDTVIRAKEKDARFSRKSVIAYDENGEPHEDIVEEFSGSEDLRPMLAFPDATWEFVPPVEELPWVNLAPAMAGIPHAGLPGFFSFDTIPGKTFRWRSEREWNDFSEEFEKRFKEQFGDFYKSHEKEMEKMMTELEEKFSQHFDNERWAASADHAIAAEEMVKVQAELEAMSQEHLIEAEQLAQLAQEDLAQHMQELQAVNEVNVKQMERAMQEQEVAVLAMERQAKEMQANMKVFEKELKTQLVTDGYLKKDEELKTIDWGRDGKLRINGEEIKESDRKKYKKLRDKYFRHDRHFSIAE